VQVPLNAGDFSLIDKKAVEVLKNMPERDRFIRGLRAWAGFKQTGVSYVRPERMFGKSTNNFLKNFSWAMKGIFSFTYVPLELMTLLSLVTFFLSMIGIIAQIIIKIITPSAPQGFTTVLVVVLFIGSIQLLGISVLGQYIGKIFEEVKQRPRYIVKSIFKKE
jgi:dolichol-phosphate mannosyltransferase